MKFTDRLIIFLVAGDKDKSARALAKVTLHKEQLEELAPVGGSDCGELVIHPTRKKPISGEMALVTLLELPYAHDEELADVYHVFVNLVGSDCSLCMVNCAASIGNSGDVLMFDGPDKWPDDGWADALFEYHSHIEVT